MMDKASAIINQMMEKDLFTQWLAVERISEAEGRCVLKMLIRPEMCNGFGIAHGGITYSLADSALAFASNSRGQQAVSIETSISHILPLYTGDIITAAATEISCSGRIAVYEVRVAKEDATLVALFKGTVYRKEKAWPIP